MSRTITESDWLWSRRIPRGGLIYMIGECGSGKSILTLDIAARVSSGRPWPDGARCLTGQVLLLTREDDLGSVIRPRLEAMGANIHAITLIQDVICCQTNEQRGITLADTDAIERAVRTIGDVRLVVVDPIYEFVPPDVDVHTAHDLGDVLKPIDSLAKRHKLTVLITCYMPHFSMAGWSLAECNLNRVNQRERRPRGANAQRHLFFMSRYRHLLIDESPLFFNIVGDPARIEWVNRPRRTTSWPRQTYLGPAWSEGLFDSGD